MTLNQNIAEDVQSLQPGELVTLFELDTSIIGGVTYYFTMSKFEDSPVSYNSQIYNPLNVEAEGFDVTGKGQLPRPKMRIALFGSTAADTLRAAIEAGQDLLGCELKRRRTFRKYLDGEAEASWQAQFPTDVFVIERKSYMDNRVIEWELSAYMDHEGRKIPSRRMLRDRCNRRYRIYNAESSSDPWIAGDCPYDGDNYFTIDDEETSDPALDQCAKTLNSCQLRFPWQDIPAYMFPGLSRIQV